MLKKTKILDSDVLLNVNRSQADQTSYKEEEIDSSRSKEHDFNTMKNEE
jgi:hypothetical protein